MTVKKSWVLVGTVVAAALLVWVALRRSGAEADGENKAGAGDPVAAVVRVGRGFAGAPLSLAGAFKPFQDVDVHAKVSGYIKKMYVDVGTHVREGQTLAVLEVPEMVAEVAGADAAVSRAKDEIRRAQGDVERAKSLHDAAHAMSTRIQQASDSRAGLVAQQEVDDALAKDKESEAQISSAQASLSAAEQALAVAVADQKRYQAMEDYTRITAPFTGVVTARYADTGALLAAGTTNTQSMPVVRIAQVSVLRLVLPIPESVAGTIRLGDAVKVRIQALNQDTVGKVSRFADALDPQTRTMETEIDFQNADGKLLPGMYVEATLGTDTKKDALTVPLEGVEVNGTQGTALLVNAQDVLEERTLKLGSQGSTRVEVLSGLKEGDRVVVGSRDEFRPGMKIKPKEMDERPESPAAGVK
jgi:RND family efflux transporter MFP subunit